MTVAPSSAPARLDAAAQRAKPLARQTDSSAGCVQSANTCSRAAVSVCWGGVVLAKGLTLTAALTSGVESKEIAVVERFVPETNSIEFVSVESGEIVEAVAMTADDRRRSLFPDAVPSSADTVDPLDDDDSADDVSPSDVSLDGDEPDGTEIDAPAELLAGAKDPDETARPRRGRKTKA
jgi:hypothetical protein